MLRGVLRRSVPRWRPPRCTETFFGESLFSEELGVRPGVASAGGAVLILDPSAPGAASKTSQGDRRVTRAAPGERNEEAPRPGHP